MFLNQSMTKLIKTNNTNSIINSELMDFFSFLKFTMIYDKKPKFYFLYYFNHQYQI